MDKKTLGMLLGFIHGLDLIKHRLTGSFHQGRPSGQAAVLQAEAASISEFWRLPVLLQTILA